MKNPSCQVLVFFMILDSLMRSVIIVFKASVLIKKKYLRMFSTRGFFPKDRLKTRNLKPFNE